eukprot:NODE_19832_length_825_cov_11.494269.p2 GENE.NODE_19832_length_825_cov_11.494269~~NODE_19832_length_825_cov_11.494269.p2  ORF type:complete len:140 (+),score=45.70 NODE_19832_length_825_cov_11.494269:126-545(+)
MGQLQATSAPPQSASIFYTDDFFRYYGSPRSAAAKPVPVAPEPPAARRQPQEDDPEAHQQLVKGTVRLKLLAELREEQFGVAETAANRLNGWAGTQKVFATPCGIEQNLVQRCYAAPPGGDLLRCGTAVEAYALCTAVA